MGDIIGRVTATESDPTTCTTVRFWVRRDVFLRPFDIVRIGHISRTGSNTSHSFAMVEDLSYITDSAGHLANFVSCDFGDVDSRPLNERLGTTVAEARILGNSEDIELPIRDGAHVEWATENEILKALGLDALKRAVPAGYMQTSNNQTVPISLDWQYLIGPESAHFNISGISGLAAKTSYTMFLLSAIQQVAERDKQSVTIVVFNVKGADLLAIDEENGDIPLDRRTQWERDWRQCGLEPRPLRNVRYLYPYAKRPEDKKVRSAVPSNILQRQLEEQVAWRYYYDVHTFVGGETGDEDEKGGDKFSLLLSDIDDPAGTLHSICAMLPSLAPETWDEFHRKIQEKRQSGRKGDDIPVQSWRRFSRLVSSRIRTSDLFSDPPLNSEVARQIRISDALGTLKAGQALVIDIHELPPYLQCLVVGDVIRTLLDAKLGLDEYISSEALGKVVVFVDELNKFAPKVQGGGASEGTLARWLLDITERGRSLGVVLFGAEQFRSGVHERVLGNCATAAHGRTNPVELARAADYRQMLSASQRDNLTRLRQGEMLLQHPLFRTPMVKVQFPEPAYRQLKD